MCPPSEDPWQKNMQDYKWDKCQSKDDEWGNMSSDINLHSRKALRLFPHKSYGKVYEIDVNEVVRNRLSWRFVRRRMEWSLVNLAIEVARGRGLAGRVQRVSWAQVGDWSRPKRKPKFRVVRFLTLVWDQQQRKNQLRKDLNSFGQQMFWFIWRLLCKHLLDSPVCGFFGLKSLNC